MRTKRGRIGKIGGIGGIGKKKTHSTHSTDDPFNPNWTDQANKSVGWMPRHQKPKKDATSCDKPRVGANSR